MSFVGAHETFVRVAYQHTCFMPTKITTLSQLPEELISAITARCQHPYNLSCCSRLFYRVSQDPRGKYNHIGFKKHIGQQFGTNINAGCVLIVQATWLFYHPTVIYQRFAIPAVLTFRSIPPIPQKWPIPLLQERTVHHFIRLYNTAYIPGRLSHFDKCAVAVIWKLAVEQCWENIIVAILRGSRTASIIHRPRDYIAGLFLSRNTNGSPVGLLKVAAILQNTSHGHQESLTTSEMEGIICEIQPCNVILLLKFIGLSHSQWLVERAFHMRRMDLVQLLLDFLETQRDFSDVEKSRVERLRISFEAVTL